MKHLSTLLTVVSLSIISSVISANENTTVKNYSDLWITWLKFERGNYSEINIRCGSFKNFLDFKIVRSNSERKIFNLERGYWRQIKNAVFKDSEMSFTSLERPLNLVDTNIYVSDKLRKFYRQYYVGDDPVTKLKGMEKEEIEILDKLIEKSILRFDEGLLYEDTFVDYYTNKYQMSYKIAEEPAEDIYTLNLGGWDEPLVRAGLLGQRPLARCYPVE